MKFKVYPYCFINCFIVYIYGPQWTVYEPGLDYFVDMEGVAIWWWRGWPAYRILAEIFDN